MTFKPKRPAPKPEEYEEMEDDGYEEEEVQQVKKEVNKPRKEEAQAEQSPNLSRDEIFDMAEGNLKRAFDLIQYARHYT